jgi:membrane protein required for colicin V production
VTGFDALAIIVILASAASGWVRGGAREIVTLLAFALAAILSLIALPLTSRLGRALVDPDWAGTIFAAVIVFLILYFGMRFIGWSISKHARNNPHLGGVDHAVGTVIGTVRALVLLGAMHLVVVAALPGDRTPGWLSDAWLQPVTSRAARAIQIVLPGIGRGADALAPVVDSSVRRGFSEDSALPKSQSDNTSPPSAAP